MPVKHVSGKRVYFIYKNVRKKNITEQIIQTISANLENEIKDILQKPGKNIWLFGGAELTASLLNLNLVDELMISVHPLILGKGKLLFNNIGKRKNLKLTDVKTFSTGLVQLYTVFRKTKVIID